MATYSDVMKWVAKLDTSDVEAGFKRVKDQGEDALEGVGDEGDKLEGRFSGIGGKMGKAMVAGFAAIGVGALLLQGIEEAFSRKDSLNVVTARFDLTAKEAEKYGKIAGDLYAEGWGEGFEQVQDTAAAVGERLKLSNADAVSAITEQALTVQKVWGEDVDAVIRSVSQLLENDLVDSAQEGMDLIVAAFQNGGNEAGDLLDTIDEYSQHFELMGLSGEEAMNILIAGIQDGQRDTDKLADAIKEMRLRAVEDTDAVSDAYNDLGLRADDLRRKFLAGGDEAKEAFLTVVGAINDVEDPIEQNRLAVELIGTQFEDTGLKALDALGMIEGKLGDVEGAAEDAASAVEANEWERFKRRGENALSTVGEAFAGGVNAVFDYNNAVADGITGFFGFGDAAESSSRIIDRWASDAVRNFVEVKTATEDGTVVTAEQTAAQEAHAASLGTVTWELEQIHGQTVEYTEATEDSTEATNEAAEAFEEAAEQAENLQSRYKRLKDELSDRSAFLSVEQAFADLGAEGEATEQDILDLRGTVADYVAGLDNIPPEVLTQIDALVNQGAYEQALAQLNELERTRTTQINIRTQYSQAGSASAPTVQVNRGGPRASGGPTFAGSMHEVLEGGKSELLTEGGKTYLMAGKNGQVTPLDKLPGNGPSNIGGGEVSIHIGTLTTQARNGQQLLDELTAAVRRQGPSGIRRALGID